MQRVLILVLLVLAGVPQYSGEPALPLLGPAARFAATPVALAPGDPGRRRVGALVFERGYRLHSPDPVFGGFSALAVAGDQFTLLSDGGNIVRFRMDAAGRLSARRFAELPAGPGRGWNKNERDSESLATDPLTGAFWVGFERANQIWRFSPGLGHAEGSVAPAAMADWSENGGPEAMARLRDGRFVVLSETTRPAGMPGAREALLFSGDPTGPGSAAARFVYVPPLGYSPTDIAELPSGDLLVLNRRFTFFRGFHCVITLVPRRAVAPGSVARGAELARFASPLVQDNFEGMAVVADAHGTALWIVSDDNQSLLQQSLLLKFRLDENEIRRLLDGNRSPGNP